MLRTQIIKLTRAPIRSFSAAAVRTAEGDTGGVRSGGVASSDSFNKREAASENKFIREREMETLRQLKEKLRAQRKHLDELDAHISDLESTKGGEQN
ncbi:ATPase inhibitor [Knufia obscura]|uniref:ATPase inhibitor, mitochondrial n=2 Tax=Knufia TaxID=430999 RepID=A0AAN8F7M7_9EURO|nr:ATPase inhibitor [Knufia obscura]KAK5952946.1 ATPase inhibitor [Knufia fluminis]